MLTHSLVQQLGADHNSNLIPRDSIPRFIKEFPDFNKPDSPELIPLVLASDEELEWLLPKAVWKYGKNHIHQNAVLALGQANDPAAIPVLAECLLSYPCTLNARMAAWALGQIGTDSARETLWNALYKREEQDVIEEIQSQLACG